jgi:CHC2-type zinc finger protein/Toprim domain-containing protein/DNA primase-like protein
LTRFGRKPVMARIPDEVIERLKSEVSLQRLAEAQGITLKKHGQDVIGLCPFHDDNDPSLVITPVKNLWHCLGACQCGGSVIDWVMKLEGISFRHAVELLMNDYLPSANATGKVKRSTVPRLSTSIMPDSEDQQLLNQVIDYYHQTLKQNPDALSYLEKRGITNDAIDHFKIGVANRTLSYRLPNKNRKEGAAIRGQLQRIGLYRDTGHEHFRGSIVIPVMSRDGRYGGVPGGSTPAIDEGTNVAQVYGRKLDNHLRQGTIYHLYLPGPHKGVFNIAAFNSSKEIILCESLIDALTFWCNGYRNVTTSYGIEGFTKEHLAAFKQYNIERILIAYDRDEAGEGATKKLSKQLIKEGFDCYWIQFPKGMDANEYAFNVQPANKSLGVAVRSAVWLGKGKAKTISTEPVNEAPPLIEPVATKEEKNSEVTHDIKTENSNDDLSSLAATPVPVAPVTDIDVETNDNEIIINLGDRRYRIRGLTKNLSYEVLKINVMVTKGEAVHVDTFDLFAARHRANFIKQVSIELGVSDNVIKIDIGKVLLKLEALQDEHIKSTLEPKQNNVVIAEADKAEAVALLKSPGLLDRIINDFNRCGIVGEKTNSLVGYLAAVSRKLDNPLAIIIQSTSAAGKSSLMDAVLRFIPEEDRTQYSAMTGQSLFYMGETDLKHKVLAIVEEEGASQAAYALKLLQSEGQLTIASTSKDPDTGKLVTQEYKVEGPVMIFLTTTAIEVDEELMNRCLVLTVNEDREQTQAIHQLQRQKRTLQGLIQKTERESILNIHQNAQRLLKPLSVVNPFAEHLTFLSEQTRARRDHEKYLTLIDTIALLHQYQRQVKVIPQGEDTVHYVEVTLDDIAMANTLAHEVLGRTLDELPPQTRRLLNLIDRMVTEQCKNKKIERNHYHFSRRELRDTSHWSDTALKVHLARLVDMEYVIAHRSGNGSAFKYECLYDGQGKDGTIFLPGLIDIECLKQHYDANRSGQKSKWSGSGQPPVRGQSGGGQGNKTSRKANKNKASSDIDNDLEENAYIEKNNNNGNGSSYVQSPSLVAASK